MISFHSSIDVIPFGLGLILQQDNVHRTCRVQQALGRILKAILLKDVGNGFESKIWWTLAISFWVHSWMQSFAGLPFFFGSPLKSSMISRSPTPVETYSKVMHLGHVFLCLVFYWMSFHKSMLGSHSHNPHMCCVFFLSWRSGGYESPRFCWFPLRLEEGHW